MSQSHRYGSIGRKHRRHLDYRTAGFHNIQAMDHRFRFQSIPRFETYSHLRSGPFTGITFVPCISTIPIPSPVNGESINNSFPIQHSVSFFKDLSCILPDPPAKLSLPYSTSGSVILEINVHLSKLDVCDANLASVRGCSRMIDFCAVDETLQRDGKVPTVWIIQWFNWNTRGSECLTIGQ